MQDTSFAIHPGQKKQLKDSTFYDVGNVTAVDKRNNDLIISCEHTHVALRFYRSDTIRIVMNPYDEPSMSSSFAVVKQPEQVEFNVTDEANQVTICSRDLKVVLKKQPLRVAIYADNGRLLVSETDHGMGFDEKHRVICFKDSDKADHFYGFGEKTGFLDKRGEKFTMWNSDVYAPHNPETDPLYQSIPFFMTLRKGNTHGIFFDNTFKSHFDMTAMDGTYSFSAEGGQLDYYVFLGPTPQKVLEQYTDLTGRMPLPPKWALGYHQSRYSYENEQEVCDLAAAFREKDIPLDAIHLDIHYMDGYRVFTFDSERFPEPKKLIADLKAQGIHTVPIVDSGVKADPEYRIYREGITEGHFCKYLEGNVFFGDVWPGKSAFPDFTSAKVRKWWAENHKFYVDLGIEGIWNDMNEPAVFNESKTMDLDVMHDNDGDLCTHRELHNVYGLLMCEATYNGMKQLLEGRRPFLLTRAGFAGVQRYSAVWTGDNRSFWEHLQMALPMMMNLGLSGVPFSGTDVGGFAHDCNGELLTRWTQAGLFTPFFRNHSALGTKRQEPWSFGEPYSSIIKNYIRLRYVWLPHLYTLFREAAVNGTPVMRPLFMEYPTDEKTFNLYDQFMVGDNVIVAPVVHPSVRHRVVYLPEGEWVDYWTDEIYEGGRHLLVEAGLDTMPIFIKAGTVVPHANVKPSTNVADDELTFHVYRTSQGKATYTLYEDDGETYAYEKGDFSETVVTAVFNDHEMSLEIRSRQNNYTPPWKRLNIVVHNSDASTKVSVNGGEQQMTYNDEQKITTLTLPINE